MPSVFFVWGFCGVSIKKRSAEALLSRCGERGITPRQPQP